MPGRKSSTRSCPNPMAGKARETNPTGQNDGHFSVRLPKWSVLIFSKQ